MPPLDRIIITGHTHHPYRGVFTAPHHMEISPLEAEAAASRITEELRVIDYLQWMGGREEILDRRSVMSTGSWAPNASLHLPDIGDAWLDD